MTVPWQACSSRLVGRASELSVLDGMLEAVRDGRPGGLVLVSGEAGVGKSRLVREVAGRAERRGVRVLSGRAVPSGEPYRPLVEAMTAALRDKGLPDDDALRPYLPVLAAVLPDARVAGRVDARGGVVLGEAVLRLISALAADRGALVVLEDLHWVDPDTLAVLTYLAHAAESTPLLIVVTAREDVAPPAPLMEMIAACQASVLSLGRLGAEDVREIVDACLRGRPPDEVVAFAVANADGLPLLVEELLTGLGSVGALTPDGRLVGPLTPGVPRTFAATVRKRIDDFDDSSRAVVNAAAVLGRRFDWTLLPEITDLPRETVLAGLRAAVRSGLIEAEPQGETFRFRHALTSDAVRDEMLPPERRALARRGAELVERDVPDAYALAAGLREAAGDQARAAELSVLAGAQAVRRGAVHSADLLLTRAIELAGDGPRHGEAERTLLDVLAAKGDAERALSLGERLLAQGDTGVRLVLAQVAASAERWDVAAAYLSAVPADGDGTADAAAGVLAARLAHARGRPEEAQRMAGAALAKARAQAEWSVACQALEVIGRAARVDDADAAREAFAAAEDLALEHDLPLDRVSALHELGTVDLLVDGSTGRLERARSLAYDAGVLKLAATLDLQISAGMLHRDADRALVHARRCADLARRLRADLLWATAVYFQAVAHAHRREDEEVERCVRQALALAPDDLEINAGIWGAVRAHVALLADDRQQLAADLDKAVDYLRRSPTTAPTPIRGLWALVRTLDGKDGERAREETRPYTVNWENAALLGYAEAVEAGRAGRRADADKLLAEADTALADLPWWRHRIRLLVADAALTDGWGDPVGWSREALPVFADRGDTRLASRCRELLRKAGAPVPRPGRGDTPVPPRLRAAGVTSREVDVLTLVAQGMTNTAIARKLVLSPRTVETHVANLVSKTGVPNRAGLAELVRHPKSGTAGD